jgi:peptide/nickel transport system permease protein
MNQFLHQARYMVSENLLTFVAFLLFTGIIAGTLGGPWLAPYDPLVSDTARALQPPSWAHWFGTDHLGRDIFSRVLVATRLMGIVAALGNTVANIVYATAIINLPFYARLARSEVNVRRSAGFVEAARLCGNSEARVLAVHLIPNIMPPMMVQVSLNMGWAILNAGCCATPILSTPRSSRAPWHCWSVSRLPSPSVATRPIPSNSPAACVSAS